MRLKLKNRYVGVLLIVLYMAWFPAAQAQESQTIMEYLVRERPVLAGLVTKAGFSPLLSGDEQITFFAPPESALQSISNESPERLRAILSSHMVRGAYLEQDLKDGKPFTSVCGTANIKFFRQKDGVLANGIRVAQPNLRLKNGVVHGLSGLMRS